MRLLTRLIVAIQKMRYPMNNIVGLILSAALIADTIANLLRLRGVEKAMRQQSDMMRRSDIEAEKRINAASELVGDIVRETVETMIGKAKQP
jgi:hypothetical protein